MPSASIIIPTHNRPHLLTRAVESARAAGSDVEIIVVDDASIDETASVCRALAGIKYIRLERNQGVAGARNIGIMASASEFIAFLDDDDLRLPGSLDLQTEALAANPEIGFVCGAMLMADQDYRLTGEISSPRHASGDLFWQLLELDFPVMPLSVLIRKDCFLRAGLLNRRLRGIDDWDILVRIAELYPVMVMGEPVGIYRRPTPLSEQGSSAQAAQLYRAVQHQSQLFSLPRVMSASKLRRRETRRRTVNRVADTLLWNAARRLPERDFKFAAANILTALRLNPLRALRPGVFKKLTERLTSRRQASSLTEGASGQSFTNHHSLSRSPSSRSARVADSTPLTSIIITTHSRPHLLTRAVESARAAGTNIEVVVVDDASTDETGRVGKTLPMVNYVRVERNQRVAGARNVGLLASCGEYVTFLDDDDLRLPGSLDEQIKFLEADRQAGLIYGQAVVGDQAGKPTEHVYPLVCQQGDVFWNLLGQNFIPCGSAVFRRSCLNCVGLPDNSLPGLDDWDLWIRIAELYPIIALEKPVMIWRRSTPVSGQGTSRAADMVAQGVRQFRQSWLKLPRAADASPQMRRVAWERFSANMAAHLVWEAMRSLRHGDINQATKNIFTALRLCPVAVARLARKRNVIYLLRTIARQARKAPPSYSDSINRPSLHEQK